MSLKIGIVGLPNVGKSTLFNALIKGSRAEAANYPFCTIEPNVGMVEVPDGRLKVLADISHSKKIVPAVVEFVDIAGLVAGASKGEGLGNQFLAHIREVDAIAMVVRFFPDENVIHVAGKINPQNDIAIIETELALKDLETVDKRLLSLQKELKAGDTKITKITEIIKKVKDKLDDGRPASDANLTDEEKNLIKELGLLTLKPVLYIANCSEEQLTSFPDAKSKIQTNNNFIFISAKIESELNELSDDEKNEYLKELGLKDSGLNRLIRKAYETLGLVSYFTSGEQETRAWTVKIGISAPQAAGVIHTDFERGFIAAEVVKFNDFVENGGWAGSRAKGLVKTEGKDYVVHDGDVILFRFNV